MNKEEREEIRAEARRELKRINQEFDEKTILGAMSFTLGLIAIFTNQFSFSLVALILGLLGINDHSTNELSVFGIIGAIISILMHFIGG